MVLLNNIGEEFIRGDLNSKLNIIIPNENLHINTSNNSLNLQSNKSGAYDLIVIHKEY